MTLAMCWSATAQQYTPPVPSSMDASEAMEQQVVVALSEEAMFRGTGVDAATRAEIVDNLRGANARALTIAQFDPGLVEHQVPGGSVVLPLDMSALAQHIMEVPGGGLADTCALPGVSVAELAAIGRLLRQRLVQSSGDAVGFEANTPKDCPLKQLRYYSKSALLIAPSP
ncbi:hypothetical protein [Pseudoxanthomonas wuyuanensis]|uniref:hypothetical protein n=1 Tax=Pseudoxanthomonas wuyuanensis TaxID=1073196 RepID=UPI001144FE6D|nr:hypothetical protein [Pseudoxanthomonas wuyuanensis]